MRYSLVSQLSRPTISSRIAADSSVGSIGHLNLSIASVSGDWKILRGQTPTALLSEVTSKSLHVGADRAKHPNHGRDRYLLGSRLAHPGLNIARTNPDRGVVSHPLCPVWYS